MENGSAHFVQNGGLTTNYGGDCNSSSEDECGDPLDDDAQEKEDMDARKVCCGETRLNCQRFGQEMGSQWTEIKMATRKIEWKKHCQDFFSVKTLKKRLPILSWAPKYRLAELQGDLIAGFTIGLTVIPQSIAYASIAGLPPECGLYSAFLGSFVYVLFGTSKDITLGPSAICSLLVGLYANSPVAEDASYAILLAFLAGLIQLGMFILGLGLIMDFVSFPVIKAFATASAITIAASQLKKWLGLTGVPSDFLHQLYWTFKKLPETRLWDFVLGCACIVIIITLRKLKEMRWKTKFRDLPLGLKIWKKTLWVLGTARNVIAIVLATIVAVVLKDNNLRPFTLTGYISPGIPPFRPPPFSLSDEKNNITYDLNSMANSIGVGMVMVPVIGLVEAMAIGNVFARKFNYRIDPNQELLAYGIGNVLTSFVGGYPVTGTFSRTALNAQSGVKSPAGGIVTGIIVLLALQFLTPVFEYIPQASLAVVIIVAVMDMITFHKIWIFWKTKKLDLIPWLLTFVVSLTINIAYGVLIGAGVSLVMLLYPTARPKIKVIQRDADIGRPFPDDNFKIVLVEFNSGLMYPAVGHLKDKIIPLYTGVNLPKGVILDFQHVAVADTTTVQGIRTLIENCFWNGILLVICNMQKQVDTLFTKSNLKYFTKTSSISAAVEIILKRNNEITKNASTVELGEINLASTTEVGEIYLASSYDDIKNAHNSVFKNNLLEQSLTFKYLKFNSDMMEDMQYDREDNDAEEKSRKNQWNGSTDMEKHPRNVQPIDAPEIDMTEDVSSEDQPSWNSLPRYSLQRNSFQRNSLPPNSFPDPPDILTQF